MPASRVLITAGGTGGHLFPAQALANQLRARGDIDICFAGKGLSHSPYFDRNSFFFRDIASSAVISRNPFSIVKGCMAIGLGLMQSMQLLKQYHPSVVVGFGSYHTVPVLLSALGQGIPVILHEANSMPGRVNRWLSPYAKEVAIQFPAAARHFTCNTTEVALPLRKGYCKEEVNRYEALAYYGFSPDLPTLLVVGGSQGAQALNKAIEESIPSLKQLHLQVIHLTGREEIAEQLRIRYHANGIKSCVKSFEMHMEMAWRVADAFIGRAGAGTIAEAIAFEVPGILIPYPHATDHHQETNAELLVKTIGAAMLLLEAHLNGETLSSSIVSLYSGCILEQWRARLQNYRNRPSTVTLEEIVQRYCH